LGKDRNILTVATAIGLAGAFCPYRLLPAEAAGPSRPPGLQVSGGAFLKDGRPCRAVGVNYYDLFQRVWRDPKDGSSLEGLGKLARAGIPFVRFACSGFAAKDWERYFAAKEEALDRLDLVVRAAEREGIGLIPSLFWSWELHRTVGEPRGAWGDPGSKTQARAREYVRDIVTRYKDSPAIWAWEFGNEANLMTDLPNAAQFRPPGGSERDDWKAAHLVTMLAEFGKAVRAIDPSRPIISGNSHPRPAAWHNSREGSWKADDREQSREILLRDNPAPLDTIGIHIYGGGPASKDVAAWAEDRAAYLRWVKGVAREAGRPVFIGEFGVEAKVDPTAVRAEFEALLDAMERAEVDLAALWVFDLPHQTTWSASFENDRSYMLRLIAEANRRWKAR
jgi:hypothetical protein